MKLYSLLDQATKLLAEHSIPTPRLDAEVLIAHLLQLDRAKLYSQSDRTVTKEEEDQIQNWIDRRLKEEPVSYIRGIKEFWSLPFKVGPGVMIPRPDTEVLVESVLRIACQVSRKSNFSIIDIGTGSGNIAIALAKEFPGSQITAVDLSAGALEYARENAKKNEVDSQINFINQDFSSFVLRPSSFNFDLIVSNPPYIPTAVVDRLPPGIKNYEPREALDGGPDGLDFYRKLGESFPQLLRPKGMVAVEIGEDQAQAVVRIFTKYGLGGLSIIKDLAGLPRVVMGSRLV